MHTPNTTPSLTNRLVWIVSDTKTVHGYPEEDFWHEEKYRSDLIRIPPNGKKRVLMPLIEASKFLGQVYSMYDPYPNGSCINPDTGKVEKERLGKPLRVLELTDEERLKYEGLSPKAAMEKALQAEKELSEKKHTNDGQSVIAVGSGKPQAHSTRRRSVSEVSISDGDIQRITE